MIFEWQILPHYFTLQLHDASRCTWISIYGSGNAHSCSSEYQLACSPRLSSASKSGRNEWVDGCTTLVPSAASSYSTFSGFFVARTAPATCTSSRYEQKSIGGASFWWTCRIFVLAFFSAFGSWVALKIVVQWTVCNGNQWISWWLGNLNKVQRGTSAPQITT